MNYLRSCLCLFSLALISNCVKKDDEPFHNDYLPDWYLSGVVTDAETGELLPNASIEVRGRDPLYGDEDVYRGTRADGKGKYRFVFHTDSTYLYFIVGLHLWARYPDVRHFMSPRLFGTDSVAFNAPVVKITDKTINLSIPAGGIIRLQLKGVPSIQYGKKGDPWRVNYQLTQNQNKLKVEVKSSKPLEESVMVSPNLPVQVVTTFELDCPPYTVLHRDTFDVTLKARETYLKVVKY